MESITFDNIDEGLLKKFKQYHIENPSVYRQFKKYSFAMLGTGRPKYSAWTIINKIRWDHDISTTDKSFKINNDFIALYARLLIYHHPEFLNFFELRKMKEFNRRDSAEERYRASDSTTTGREKG